MATWCWKCPDACELTSLPVPDASLAADSQRSLIVTRRVSAETSLLGEAIQYRYFAPQHGVPEDSATGSASYWQQHSAGDELLALQRSKQGGWLASRIDRDRTWIGGRVVEDPTEAA